MIILEKTIDFISSLNLYKLYFIINQYTDLIKFVSLRMIKGNNWKSDYSWSSLLVFFLYKNFILIRLIFVFEQQSHSNQKVHRISILNFLVNLNKPNKMIFCNSSMPCVYNSLRFKLINRNLDKLDTEE